jgi:hypothetical protein
MRELDLSDPNTFLTEKWRVTWNAGAAGLFSEL